MASCVGSAVVAPAASDGTSRCTIRLPLPGSSSPGVPVSFAMKMPTRKAGEATCPRFLMVVGVGRLLPAIPLTGLATDATTRSGRKSRIVSAEALTPTSAAFSGGSTSCSPTTRLPLRIKALLVTIGTLKVLTISPGPNVSGMLTVWKSVPGIACNVGSTGAGTVVAVTVTGPVGTPTRRTVITACGVVSPTEKLALLNVTLCWASTMKIVIDVALGGPSAPAEGGASVRTIVSVPSATPSSTAVMSNVWLVTPAAKVSVPAAGLKSVTGVAVPSVLDQPMVTGPTRFAPLRVTVTRSVRPGSPGRPSTTAPVGAANW